MSQELFVPDKSVQGVVTYQVLINGQAVSPVYELLSLVITREMNRVPSAKIIFKDGDPSERKFELSDANDFVPGNPVVVNIGRDGTNDQVFKGIIIKHSVRVKETGNSELVLDCRDEAVRMAIGRHSRYYENIKDSDLFDRIVSAYPNLSANSKTTSLTHEELVQHHVTDWDFLLMRAEANNMLVNVIDGKVNIAKPETTAKPTLELAFGSSILEFEAGMDVRNQWKKVEASSWDYHNQSLFTADTSAASGWKEAGNIDGSKLAQAINLDQYEMHHSGYLLQQELQDWVDSLMLRSRLAKICGRAKCKGFSGIKPGDLLSITGVGNRFNGNVFVTAVRHDVGDGMWDTHIQFGMDTRRYAELYSDINDAQAAGLVGGIRGLQVGITVKLEDDPEGQDRILVKLPTIDNNGNGIWTRMASLDAGNNRGAFFRPEIGDEVIVGFINDDPREAVVLGMLNSSAKPAPIKAEKANDKKGFTTRSGMHVSFDDGKNTISIDTPANNKIILDDTNGQIQIADQNQNSITMDASGITVSSNLDVNIKAAGNMTLSADISFSLSAPNISISADAVAAIKGTTVMIN